MIYALRRGPFQRPVTWRLEPGLLIEERPGRPDRIRALSELRSFRIAAGINRYLPGERVLSLTFRRGRVAIGSHGFVRLAQYADQTFAFAAFARELAAEAYSAAPQARFEVGSTTAGPSLFTGAVGILVIGIVLLVLGAAVAGQVAIGLDLASRLTFVLILLFAAAPWFRSSTERRFDPLAIGPELLP